MLVFDLIGKGPILFIGCHPDDIEYGCGGLISKLRGKTSMYGVTLSKNQKNPKNKNLLNENKKSLRTLGISGSKYILGDFTTREFSYSRQEICDYLWKIKNKIKPTCVFIPPFDLHQDHQTAHNECLRVFRNITSIEYNISRSEKFPKPVLFVTLNKKNINEKLKALSQYKTYEKKNYFKKDVIVSECISNGIKVEIPMCEIFSPVSIILK